MIGNKIASKITSTSRKKSAKELHNNDETKEEEDAEITTHKKRYISAEGRQQIIDELRLVPKKYVKIKIHISKRKTTSYLIN